MVWARKRRGVGQADLADALGFTRQTLGRYERDKYKPSLEEIERLCSALQVEPGWLAFNRGDPFTLPRVNDFLQTQTGMSLPPPVQVFLRHHSHRMFASFTPSDTEIEVAAVLVARLLRDAPHIGNGDKTG